jgi:hypothetical protein
MVRHRLSAWKAYYATLSIILQNDIPYELGPEVTAATGKTNAKLPQRTELKRVEVIYENLLLKETHFPKASDGNQEIEEWADAVMLNWRVLCGPTWGDDDLGEGGKEAVGRGVLDVSYCNERCSVVKQEFCLTHIYGRFSTGQRPKHSTPQQYFVICLLSMPLLPNSTSLSKRTIRTLTSSIAVKIEPKSLGKRMRA